MSHNTFSTLSPSWVTYKGNARINFASNIFNQPLEDVSSSSSTNNLCTFQNNRILTVSPNKTSNSIFHNCFIENVFFELPCECEMESFPKTHKDQLKCLVSHIEQSFCYSDEFVTIDEYRRTSCSEDKTIRTWSHGAWSQCGTKIHVMIIGVCLAIGIIIANVVYCFISKRRKTRNSLNRPSFKNAATNNYNMNESKLKKTADANERQSGELIIDDLGPGLGKIKVTTNVSKKMQLRELPMAFRDRIEATCVPAKCFPKHVNTGLNKQDDDYYSNDREFEK